MGGREGWWREGSGRRRGNGRTERGAREGLEGAAGVDRGRKGSGQEGGERTKWGDGGWTRREVGESGPFFSLINSKPHNEPNPIKLDQINWESAPSSVRWSVRL